MDKGRFYGGEWMEERGYLRGGFLFRVKRLEELKLGCVNRTGHLKTKMVFNEFVIFNFIIYCIMWEVELLVFEQKIKFLMKRWESGKY